MGRRRKFEEPGCVVCGYVPYSLARAVEEIARAEGKSISDIVYEALREYVESKTIELGLRVALEAEPGADGQVEMDKVALIEAEEFEERLSRLEEYAGSLYEQLGEVRALLERPGLLSLPGNGRFARIWWSKVGNAVDWFYKLKGEYDKLRQKGAVRKGWDMRLYEVWAKLRPMRKARLELERLLGIRRGREQL